MKKINTILFLLFLCSVHLNAQLVEHIYDFNDLEEGDIHEQDDWVSVLNFIGPTDLIVVGETLNGILTPDNTLGAFYCNSTPAAGRTIYRESTDALPFDLSIGGVMEFELEMVIPWWGGYFGFAYDKNDNGYPIKGIEQVVNLDPDEGGVLFHIANKDPGGIIRFFLPNGDVVDVTSVDPEEAWTKFKLFIDFTANNDKGSVSLFWAPIGGAYQAVAEVTELNLHLTPGSGDRQDPAMWNRLFLHSTGCMGAWDNLIVRQPETGGLDFQFIQFPPVADHLTTDAPFAVNATSSLGLPVSLSIESGPATVAGNEITLTGQPGIVTLKGSQAGNSSTAPAEDVLVSFEVVDPLAVIPGIEIKNPAAASVRAPGLDAVQFSVATGIEHDDILSIASVDFEVDGETVAGIPTNNGYFIGYWTPGSTGNFTMTATAHSSGGPSQSATVDFEVTDDASGMDFTVIDQLHFADVGGTLDTSFVLPSFTGTFSKVTAQLIYDCPPGGCEPWDLVAGIETRGANGEWVELLRYITPYGVACGDEVDVTDYVSQLQGKVDFHAYFPQKSEVTLVLKYEEGTPDYPYSWMDRMWLAPYPFGDMSNQDPVEIRDIDFPENTAAAKLRLVSSGHGWGDNNTNNAAEFFETTHNIRINDEVAFTQHLWNTCNPNPATCQPQNGTWFHNRAGWCPGSIAEVHSYDLADYIGAANVSLHYQFNPDYVDLCHPQNPDCETGVTCNNCLDTFNPNIRVAGELVVLGDSPLGGNTLVGIEEPFAEQKEWAVSPNPSRGIFHVNFLSDFEKAKLLVFDFTGKLVFEKKLGTALEGSNEKVDLSGFPAGVYSLVLETERGVQTEQVVKL